MCKINPKIDFAFKKLFGSEENKDLLISLINSIVNEKDRVKNVILKNPYNLANYEKDKMSILDIKAEDQNGHWINIEMQIAEDLNFDKRAIYYWSQMVSEQLSEGMMFKELSKTISICILDFNIINENPKYHTRFKILEDGTGKDYNLHDMFEMHYIELKKFRKEYKEIANNLDRWITFFNKFSKFNKKDIPAELADNPHIVKAVKEVDRMFDEEEREIYKIRLKKQMDFESKLDSAIEKGREEGIELGREEGIELGREEGLVLGREEGIVLGREKGEKDKSIEIAKNLLEVLDIDTISKKTGLTKEEIEKLE
jgi:predicted transposase/invertase (TIGR01784 family)